MARDRSVEPEAKALRLFVAIDIPAELRRRLAEATAGFRESLKVARWTGPEGWHVTLKFLGSTWPRMLPEVEEAVDGAAAATAAFESRLTELGVFPSPRRARVVWAGLADPDRQLAAMARDLDDRLSDHFVPEERELTPHLTLARLAPPRDLDEFVPDLVGTSIASDPFPIRELVLYRSRLSAAGATYEPLRRAALGG